MVADLNSFFLFFVIILVVIGLIIWGLFKFGKKSENPFKMWGSYVGLVLGIIVVLPILIPFFSNGCVSSVEAGLFSSGSSSNSCFASWIFFIPSIIGFLIGWGVHSLIRAVKN